MAVCPLLMGQEGCQTTVGRIAVQIEPLNPAPWQDVTVTVSVFPSLGLPQTLQVRVVGSDGYFSQGPIVTDADGVASFVSPGGASGTYDRITISWPLYNIEEQFEIVF